MAAWGARRLGDMADNAAAIVALELLAAAQGLDFHRPLKSSASLEDTKLILREVVAFWDRDRFFAPDLEHAKTLVVAGKVASGHLWLVG